MIGPVPRFQNVQFRTHEIVPATRPDIGGGHAAQNSAQSHQSQTAIMCAEAVWWQCHRRIIADYLLAANEIVFHIMNGGRVERAEMTQGAKRESDEILTYPALL
jgi:Protein of unknown function, DUF488